MLYAMSDIHGYWNPFQEALKRIGDWEALLETGTDQDKLLFLGDYVDGGSDSFQVLSYLRELQLRFPKNVVVLKGNHDQDLIDFLYSEDALTMVSYYTETLSSFLSETQREHWKKQEWRTSEGFLQAVRGEIRQSHPQLCTWLRHLPAYYRTDKQVFVHAGIDEEAGEYWEWGSSEDVMLRKYPPSTGNFPLDIIAGHVGTYELAKNPDFHGVFHDGAAHYFIDGTVEVSGRIPVLAYDSHTGKYESI